MGLQKVPSKAQIEALKKSKKTTRAKLDSAINYQSTTNTETPKTKLKNPLANQQGKPYYKDYIKNLTGQLPKQPRKP